MSGGRCWGLREPRAGGRGGGWAARGVPLLSRLLFFLYLARTCSSPFASVSCGTCASPPSWSGRRVAAAATPVTPPDARRSGVPRLRAAWGGGRGGAAAGGRHHRGRRAAARRRRVVVRGRVGGSVGRSVGMHSGGRQQGRPRLPAAASTPRERRAVACYSLHGGGNKRRPRPRPRGGCHRQPTRGPQRPPRTSPHLPPHDPPRPLPQSRSSIPPPCLRPP